MVTIEELRQSPVFSDLPDETLQWIIEKSVEQTYEVDEVMNKTGDQIDEMIILITGSWDFYWDTNGQLTYFISWNAGEIGGLLPYSRMKKAPGYSISTAKGKALRLHKKYFEEMERRYPELVARLVQIMTDRVRTFTALQQQQEKMTALGRMSAGLAHELNNPAAAIQRTISELKIRLSRHFDHLPKFIESHPEKDSILEVVHTLIEKGAHGVNNKYSPVERADIEDQIYEYLKSLNINESASISETFADLGMTTEELSALLKPLSRNTIEQILPWATNLIASDRLIEEVQIAANRISQLVNSIKVYSHMDRSADMQAIDVHDGLDNTLILLDHKIKKKNIHVKKDYFKDAPKINAFPGELNQVWTNLIDNAIDAMDQGGTLEISTSTERNMVKVCIADNGHGIPPEIKNKIFDPFFTTKSVGKGIGLGLDVVKRIISQHHAEIKVNSSPGHTEFIVCVPIYKQLKQQDQSITEESQ